MAWIATAYALLVQVTLAGAVLSAVAYLAVRIVRQPARKARVIQLALLGLVALPLLAALPGYPRWAILPAEWTEPTELAEPTETAAREIVAPQIAASPAIEDPSLGQPAVPLGDDAEIPSDVAATGTERIARADELPAELPSETKAAPEVVVNRSPVIDVIAEQPVDALSPLPGEKLIAPAADFASREAHGDPPAGPGAERGNYFASGLPRDVRFWVVAGYLAAAAGMAGWMLLGRLALARLVRGARTADAALAARLEAIAGPAGARVRLLVSPRAAQPCAFGWWRPTIVLPERLASGGDARSLRFALAHEWSHLERGDVAAWQLASLARLIHVQQPLVWLLRRELRLAQDYLADAAAAGSGTPEDYAEFLTFVSREPARRLSPGLGIFARRSELHRRIVMLVENAQPLERAVPRRWNVLAMLLAICAVAAAASLRAEPNALPETPATVEAGAAGTEPPATAEQTFLPPSNSAAEPAPRAQAPPTDEGPLLEPWSGSPHLHRRIERLFRELDSSREHREKLLKLAAEKTDVQERQKIEAHFRQLDEHCLELSLQIDDLIRESRQAPPSPRTYPSSKSASPRAQQPFSGKIRPGDILTIEIGNGPPFTPLPPRTVEPDGNLPLGPEYAVDGKVPRIAVAGMTLSEAEDAITKFLKQWYKNASTLVTYTGHDDRVVAVGESAEAVSTPVEPVVLAPLDTIEIRMGVEVKDKLDYPKGMYLIEPDGRVALAQGRIKIAGLTEAEAGAAIRAQLAEHSQSPKALPSVHVLRRGRAVFPDGKTPTADYRVQVGDSVLVGSWSWANDGTRVMVADDGTLPHPPTWSGHRFSSIKVAGLTLEEAQQAVRKVWLISSGGGGFANQNPTEYPWLITLGGWREEADPAVIDRIENPELSRVEQLEQELRRVKQRLGSE